MLTKDYITIKINNFGKDEYISLIKEDRLTDAHQIEHARLIMSLSLNGGVSHFLENLNNMVEFTIDKDGFWRYDPSLFVHHEETRSLLIALREELATKRKEHKRW